MRRLRWPVASAMLVALALVFALGAAQPEDVAPGVSIESLRDSAGPWEIRVIRIDRNEPQIDLVAALGRGELRGRERLNGIIRRETEGGAHVVAAVNADFFRMTGDAAGGISGPCARNGELITTPRGRPGFYINANGEPQIETTRSSAEITVGERSWPMDSMNMPDEGGEGCVQICTKIGGWDIAGGCVVASLEGGPLRSTGRWQGAVTEVVAPGTARSAGEDEVLIVARNEQVREALLQAEVGEPVTIALDTPPFTEPVLQAVGGNRELLRDGQIVFEDQIRHPRTAAGFNDQEILLVTVDGRQPGWSVGMTMTELAELMLRLGCTDAVNLDGGGSTTFWTQWLTLNKPSGGAQRTVANGLLVIWDRPSRN